MTRLEIAVRLAAGAMGDPHLVIPDDIRLFDVTCYFDVAEKLLAEEAKRQVDEVAAKDAAVARHLEK